MEQLPNHVSVGQAAPVRSDTQSTQTGGVRAANSTEAKVDNTANNFFSNFEQAFDEGEISIEDMGDFSEQEFSVVERFLAQYPECREDVENGTISMEDIRKMVPFEEEVATAPNPQATYGAGSSTKVTDLTKGKEEAGAHAPTAEGQAIASGQQHVASAAPKEVRADIDELHASPAPPKLEASAPQPSAGGIKGKIGGLKQRFNDWVQAKKLDRAGDIGSPQFPARLDKLVASARKSSSKLDALGKALEQKIQSTSNKDPVLSAKVDLLKMGSNIKWNTLGEVKGLKAETPLSNTQLAGVLRQLGSQQQSHAREHATADLQSLVKSNPAAKQAVEAFREQRDTFWDKAEGQKLQKEAYKDTFRTTCDQLQSTLFSRPEISAKPSKAMTEEEIAICTSLKQVDDARFEARVNNEQFDLGFENGKFVFGSAVTDKSREAAKEQLLTLVGQIAEHGLGTRSIEGSPVMTTLAVSMLTSPWAEANLGSKALDGFKQIAESDMAQGYERVGKYGFTVDLADVMAEILPVIGNSIPEAKEEWSKYIRNVRVLQPVIADTDRIRDSIRKARNMDELKELNNPETNKQLYDVNLRMTSLFLYLDDNPPAKFIGNAVKAYIEATVPQDKKEEVQSMVDNLIKERNWPQLNQYMMQNVIQVYG